jgi:hypothetical protein
MANELCASGFTVPDVDGQYNLMYTDHWKNANGKYWIYKDSYFWMISSSEFLYETGYLVAKKLYTPGSWANGDYHSTGPWEEEGAVIGNVASAVCP